MNRLFYLLLGAVLPMIVMAQHPRLSLTEGGVERIRAGLGQVPAFDAELQLTRKEVDTQLKTGEILVPIPRDMAGGYTHEQHKYNYKLMYKAGNLYQITGEEKYARLVREMLLSYAAMYPDLPLHPTQKSYATGKIFWQCLNDANWLVFVSQAYDCVYDFLTPAERSLLENQLFVPFADFLSIENPKFFNRIHNHSTWANAAVGMIALVMDNDTLLQKALYGLKNDGISTDAYDNDGGFIKKDGVTSTTFVHLIEAHGNYSRITEIPIRPYASIQTVNLLHQTKEYVIVSFATETTEWTLCMSLTDPSPDTLHAVVLAGRKYHWQGIYELSKQNIE